MKIKYDKNGFTLIEVLIAIFILSIGLLGVMSMQIHAIQGNASASKRSMANAVALTVLEELKRLPFSDANLATGGMNLNAGMAVGGGAPTPGNADHMYNSGQLPLLSNIYQTSGTNLVDSTGTSYQIFWNIDKPTITIGVDTFIPYCTIRLFMYWATPMGTSHLEITAYKYNNVTL